MFKSWGFKENRLIFMAGTTPEVASEAEKSLELKVDTTTLLKPEELWAKIDETHSPSNFEKSLQGLKDNKELWKYNTSEAGKDAALKATAERYTASYKALKTQYDLNIEVIKIEHDEVVEAINRYTKESLSALKSEIEKMEVEAPKDFSEMIREVRSGGDAHEILDKALESGDVSESDFDFAISVTLSSMMDDIAKRGKQDDFVGAMEMKTGEELDFESAKAVMKEQISSLVSGLPETSSKEIFDLFIAMAEATNKGRSEYIKDKANVPDPMRSLVVQSREELLSNQIEPLNESDRIVFAFLNASFEAQKTMFLMKPEVKEDLFNAISHMNTNYPSQINRRLNRKKADAIRTARGTTAGPTAFDRNAKIMATLALASEAKWTIDQFAKTPEFNGIDQELKKTKAKKYRKGELALASGKLLKAPRTLYSSAELGGFNGYDIALGLGKGLTIFTVASNLLNSRGDENKSFLENMIENPALITGGALWYGIDKLQDNPELRNYLREDAFGKERVMTIVSLRSMSDALKPVLGREEGPKKLKSFINDSDEFDVMEHLNKQKVKNMLKKATKANSKAPRITTEMLMSAVGEKGKEEVGDLESDTESDYVRYLFYKKFLTKNRSIPNLEGHCKQFDH